MPTKALPVWLLLDVAGVEPNCVADTHGHGAQIVSGSVFAEYYSTQEITSHKKSADKLSIGYTHQGLPFMIVVDTCRGGGIFRFIDEKIIPRMSSYAARLIKCNTEEAKNYVIRVIIKEIYQEIFEDDHYLEHRDEFLSTFTMSLAVTYSKDEQLFCSGFGIGNTGIILSRTDGSKQQLVAKTTVDRDGKDTFGKEPQENIDLIIARNPIFNTRVGSGDALVGYTYLFDDMEESDILPEIKPHLRPTIRLSKITPRLRSTLKRTGKTQLISHASVSSHVFPPSGSLFNALRRGVAESYHRTSSYHQTSRVAGKRIRFGDDCTIGEVIIPSVERQQEINTDLKKDFAKINKLMTAVFIVIVYYSLLLTIALICVAAGVALSMMAYSMQSYVTGLCIAVGGGLFFGFKGGLGLIGSIKFLWELEEEVNHYTFKYGNHKVTQRLRSEVGILGIRPEELSSTAGSGLVQDPIDLLRQSVGPAASSSARAAGAGAGAGAGVAPSELVAEDSDAGRHTPKIV